MIPGIFRYGLSNGFEVDIHFPWLVRMETDREATGALGDVLLIPKISLNGPLSAMAIITVPTGVSDMSYYPFSRGVPGMALGLLGHLKFHRIYFLTVNLYYTFQGKTGEEFLPIKLNLAEEETFSSLFGLADFWGEMERYENDFFSLNLGTEYYLYFLPLHPSLVFQMLLRTEDNDQNIISGKIDSVFGARINGFDTVDLSLTLQYPFMPETRTFYMYGWTVSLYLYL